MHPARRRLATEANGETRKISCTGKVLVDSSGFDGRYTLFSMLGDCGRGEMSPIVPRPEGYDSLKDSSVN